MIVINSREMYIPREEVFIGFAGDNLHSTRQFKLTDFSDADCTFELYLTFDNGATTHFVLDSKMDDGSTLLFWGIQKEHILKSGLVKAQIKVVALSGEVHSTPSNYFIVGALAEISDDNSYKENTDLSQFEEKLNKIAQDFVEKTLTVAGMTLEKPISTDKLQEALRTYPVIIQPFNPTEYDTAGSTGQLCAVPNSDYTAYDLYVCTGKRENSIYGNFKPIAKGVSSDTTPDKIQEEISKYFVENPIELDGYVPTTRHIAGLSLEKNIFVSDLQTALNVYPVKKGFKPTEDTLGIAGQFLIVDNDVNSYDLYFCERYYGNGKYLWKQVDSSSLTDEQITAVIENYFIENPIENGADGKDGEDGKDGYTPIKGVDYFTESDKAQLVDEVAQQTGASVIPDYVISEAESVINRVLQAQGNRTFTFAAITDLHYGNSDYTDGIKHACQAIKHIDKHIKLDAVAILGDYTDGYPSTDITDAMADFKAINSMLDSVKFAPNIRQMGNHDYYADNIPVTRRLIQAHSDNVVWGDMQGGYFYRDFADYKLRIICLNTNENNPIDTSTNKPTSNISMTSEQCQWFADTLDMSNKENAGEWQILVLSHQPLDYWATDSAYRLSYIVDAYKNGTSWNDSVVSCDYTGKNQAVLIGNIHGHIHNLLTDTMYRGNSNSSEKTSVYRLSTPNACFGRENQYTGTFSEVLTYSKTQNSAQDTSFVVYCIDLDTYTVKAICYGAGYDRELVYNIPSIGYTNQLAIAIDTDGSIYNGKGFIDDTRLNSSGATATATGASATGFISVAENAVVRLKNVSIAPTDSTTDYIHLYDENFTHLIGCKTNLLTSNSHWINTVTTDETTGYITSFTLNGGYGAWDSVKYMRLSTRAKLNDTSIITVNETIE